MIQVLFSYFNSSLFFKAGVYFRAERTFQRYCNVIGWLKKEAIPLVKIDVAVRKSWTFLFENFFMT